MFLPAHHAVAPVLAALLLVGVVAPAEARQAAPRGAALSPLISELDKLAAAVEPELLAWRRYLHEHPELSNRETETAKYITERLKSIGLEPRTGIARTGVVAVLKGGRPGPVIALRADMDGLPVREQVDVPFASKASSKYEGQDVGVMHACGHDAHMAILLATARVLSQVRDRLPGTVKFIFQPAEEGVPASERPAGASLMVKEGVLTDPRVEAIFGLHVFANVAAGHITYRSGSFMAAADVLEITVKGRQTHGSMPWRGVDPVLTGSQIVTALQSIVSRSVDITRLPAVVSIGQFQAGVRNNIIPDTARLVGTIRTFDEQVQADIHARIKRIAEGVAAGAGATVDVTITKQTPVTANDRTLTARMLPTLERVAPGKVHESELITGAEDFSFYGREVPSLFFFVGVTPAAEVGRAPANHSPFFSVDETALLTGVRALAHLTVDYLEGKK